MNSNIDKYNELLDKKAENVYKPICQAVLGISEKVADANIALDALETLRGSYNNSIDQKNNIFESLIRLNKEIFKYKIDESYKQFTLLKSQESEEKKLLNNLYKMRDEIQKDLEHLLQKKKNINIAVDHINNGLQYVFFSPTRLELRAEDNAYALYSNWLPVKPSSVSCGERNIIALCYFFTQIMDNLNETDMYLENFLL